MARRAVYSTAFIEVHSGRFRRDFIGEIVTLHWCFFVALGVDLRIVVIVSRAAVADKFGQEDDDFQEDDKCQSEEVDVVIFNVADVEEEEREDCDEHALL